MLSTPVPRPWHRSFRALAVLLGTAILVCLLWNLHEPRTANSVLPIPKKIWQLWIHPTEPPDRDWRDASYTWIELNPGWDYVLAIMNDASAGMYVRDTFRHRPDIVDAYMSANETIERADFLRYLLLLKEGGVYSDLDTGCAKPVKDWIEPRYGDDVGLAIGIEIDDFFGGHFDHERPNERYLQFCQWTIMARPQHPTMQKVVDRVTQRLQSGSAGTVMGTTGPRIFTDAVLESLSDLSRRKIRKEELAALTEPYQIGDVLILPINAFGSGQTHSGSKMLGDCDPLAVHAFAGSWRGDIPN